MKFLGVHPGPLMSTKVFLRLEPLELVNYEIPLPPAPQAKVPRDQLFVHRRQRLPRALDTATQRFVDETASAPP
jgi:hypothetical protein